MYSNDLVFHGYTRLDGRFVTANHERLRPNQTLGRNLPSPIEFDWGAVNAGSFILSAAMLTKACNPDLARPNVYQVASFCIQVVSTFPDFWTFNAEQIVKWLTTVPLPTAVTMPRVLEVFLLPPFLRPYLPSEN